MDGFQESRRIEMRANIQAYVEERASEPGLTMVTNVNMTKNSPRRLVLMVLQYNVVVSLLGVRVMKGHRSFWNT